jgi:hypothetical protein
MEERCVAGRRSTRAGQRVYVADRAGFGATPAT